MQDYLITPSCKDRKEDYDPQMQKISADKTYVRIKTSEYISYICG